MRVTRHEEFEAAHLLPGYNGPCGNLHGHSYKIEVTVEGPQDPKYYGMVMDFNWLKKAIKEVVPDHRFLYNTADTSEVEQELVEVLKKHNLKVVGYPFVPTAENMVEYFAEVLDNYIKHELVGFEKVNVVEVKLWETTNSYATWRKTC